MDWKNEHPKYEHAELGDSVPSSPWVLWNAWQKQASTVQQYTNEITLCTANKNCEPSARILLLKYASEEKGFCFYSNRNSRKGRDLEENPKAQILWYCSALQRQLRIYGTASELPHEDVKNYALSRPRESQISAYISKQSHSVSSKQALVDVFNKAEQELKGKDVPLSKDWAGYSLEPCMFEFWQGSSDRLHDRIVYALQKEQKKSQWLISRLSP